MEDYVKRPRITKKDVLRFVRWFLLEQDTELLSKYSTTTIQRYFERDTGIQVSKKFVDTNINKWFAIDEHLYRRDQPWTHPKQIDL